MVLMTHSPLLLRGVALCLTLFPVFHTLLLLQASSTGRWASARLPADEEARRPTPEDEQPSAPPSTAPSTANQGNATASAPKSKPGLFDRLKRQFSGQHRPGSSHSNSNSHSSNMNSSRGVCRTQSACAGHASHEVVRQATQTPERANSRRGSDSRGREGGDSSSLTSAATSVCQATAGLLGAPPEWFQRCVQGEEHGVLKCSCAMVLLFMFMALSAQLTRRPFFLSHACH